MDIASGDHILVNLAPFIGSRARSKQSIHCTVLDADEDRILVRTEPPYREVTLWVDRHWVDGMANQRRFGPHVHGSRRKLAAHEGW